MGRNSTPIIIGTALLGVLAVGLTLFYIAGNSAPQQTTQPTVVPTPVATSHWVAQRTIYPRTTITRDMLIESSNTSTASPADAISDPSAVVGRLANRIIRAGDVMTANSVTSAVTRVIPANIPIPSGLRGVAVWVNPDQTAAGLVDVGDRVDVVVTHELHIEKQGEQVVLGAVDFASGRTIAQDIEVLAVDRSITEYQPTTPPTAEAPGTPGTAAGNPVAPSATPAPTPAPANNGQERKIRVILAVKPAEAQRIVAADRLGDIHLTIRNPASHDHLVTGEAREYPSRVIGAIKSTPKPSEPRPITPPPSWPTVSPAPILPAPAIGTDTHDDNSSDVTVIRGTEKTRAIVPR